MFHLTVRIQNPTQEEIKYLTNRLSADIGAKQILPTLFMIGRDEDSAGEEITTESITDLMSKIDEKVDFKAQWVVTQVVKGPNWYDIDWGLNDSTMIEKAIDDAE